MLCSCCIEMDQCRSQPCKNGGTCLQDMNNYKCQCREGFRGTNCEGINLHSSHVTLHIIICGSIKICFCFIVEELKCHSNPCQNGGTCFENSGGFTCTCPEGYKGVNCAGLKLSLFLGCCVMFGIQSHK